MPVVSSAGNHAGNKQYRTVHMKIHWAAGVSWYTLDKIW